MSDPRPNDELLKKRLYEIWLALGNVSHVLGNHDDAARGHELLEPIMEQLQEMWQ